MSKDLSNIADLDISALMDMFPDTKLVIKDRIPTPLLLFYTFMNINKTINQIKYSSEEIREAILALVAMVPDELRDEQFLDELKNSKQEIWVDVRPEFCEVKASLEYCQRKGIPAYLKVEQLNYFDMYHAVFNLLMRKHMLLTVQPKISVVDVKALTEDE